MGRYAVKIVVALAALVLAGIATGASYRGYVPVVISGNPGCADVPNLSFTTQVRFSTPVNGATAGGVHITVDGNTLGWYTLGDILVKAVIVKGGPNANLYRYPAIDDYSDGTLLPPVNTKTGSVYSLGSATFCY
jgi:hypothetical protein